MNNCEISGVMNSTISLFCLTIPDKAVLGIVSRDLFSEENSLFGTVIISTFEQGFVDALVGLGYSIGPLIAALLYWVKQKA